jgi:hypothetical protein
MGQLNVSFDDGLLVEVYKLAAQRGISRPELIRALVREAIGAEGVGGKAVVRASIAAPAPMPPDLIVQLTQLGLELDRVLRDVDRREGRLRKALATKTASDEVAQQKLVAAFVDHLRALEQRLIGQIGPPPDQTVQADVIPATQPATPLWSLPFDPHSLVAQAAIVLGGCLLVLLIVWAVVHRSAPCVTSPEPQWETAAPVDPTPIPTKHLRRAP